MQASVALDLRRGLGQLSIVSDYIVVVKIITSKVFSLSLAVMLVSEFLPRRR